MTKIDIYSGFLGAGKTTLIKKMIQEAYPGQNLVLIENEFGEIGIDGGFLQDAGIQITEMNSGCICCSLVGDFGRALRKVIEQYHPQRILIEPSGVVTGPEVSLGYTVAVADAGKVKVYMKNFGEFYNNQIETATTIVLSRTDSVSEEKLAAALELIRGHNQQATVVTTPWKELTGAQLVEAMEGKASLAYELAKLELERLAAEEEDEDEEEEHDHHHHHHEDEHEHHHHHDDDDDDDEEEHEHHHHHDDDEDEHEHEHHHHHHHHHADEVFTSWGVETAKKFSAQEIQAALEALDSGSFGTVLRAKGIVPCTEGGWLHFDHVPGEVDVRAGSAAVTGKLCVIGSELKEAEIAKLFGV